MANCGAGEKEKDAAAPQRGANLSFFCGTIEDFYSLDTRTFILALLDSKCEANKLATKPRALSSLVASI